MRFLFWVEGIAVMLWVLLGTACSFYGMMSSDKGLFYSGIACCFAGFMAMQMMMRLND